MAFKYVALFALIAVASALPQYYDDHHHHHEYQPVVVKKFVQPTIVKKIVEHEEPANYDFKYSVHDDHTGDFKEQHETAKDGNVEGYYSLIDADGYRRIVHYTANHEQGFIAKVERQPLGQEHKIVKAQPVIAKVAYPVVQKVAYPVVQKYVAPVVQKVQPVNYNSYDNHHDFSSQVSFNGPASNYNY